MGRLFKGIAAVGLGAAGGMMQAFGDYQKDMKKQGKDSSFSNFLSNSPVSKLIKGNGEKSLTTEQPTAPTPTNPLPAENVSTTPNADVNNQGDVTSSDPLGSGVEVSPIADNAPVDAGNLSIENYYDANAWGDAA